MLFFQRVVFDDTAVHLWLATIVSAFKFNGTVCDIGNDDFPFSLAVNVWIIVFFVVFVVNGVFVGAVLRV
jgi:hypothetical protein